MINNTRPALLIVALLLLLHTDTKAQSATANSNSTCLRAIYRLDYKLDSAVTTLKSVQMILRINNGASCFQSTSQQIFDSVYVSLKDLPAQERVQKSADASRKGGKNEFRYSILKESAKNLVFYHDILDSKYYQYQEKAPLFNWKIMPTKKTVAGYECQQAFTAFGGRTWEAWFTRDIPVSDGPYKFYGLPGLIMQVHDTHDNYVFELLSLDSKPRPFDVSTNTGAPLAPNSAAPLIKKAKFKQAKLNDELTFLDRMAGVGNKFPESMRQNYTAELKRRNNPLELK